MDLVEKADAVESAEFAAQLGAMVTQPTTAETLHITSPEGTKGWVATRQDGIETFTSTEGIAYVRARPDEEADVIVTFTRITGMTPMRLVAADQSSTVRRAERKARREQRELRKRGYDV